MRLTLHGAIGTSEYRPSAFVIQLNCSNLAVIVFLKATAKQAAVILIPQQHKCSAVVRHAMEHSKGFDQFSK